MMHLICLHLTSWIQRLLNFVPKCHKEPRKVCGPPACPVRRGERKCREKIVQVDTEQPREQCDMRPRKRCRPAMRLMPKLVPGSECTTVPREVCVTVRPRGQRRVRRPIVMEWCGGNSTNVQESTEAPLTSTRAAPTTPASSGTELEMESNGEFFDPLVEIGQQIGDIADEGDGFLPEIIDDDEDVMEPQEPQNEQEAATQKGCPGDDWMADGSKCYLVVEKNMTWDQAIDHCNEFVPGQSHLAEVTTMTEQTMLKNLLDDAKDVEFWLGGKRDERNRRQWSWVWSGRGFRVGDDSTFSYWAETEPNYEGKCLSVFWRQRNRKWVANKCSLDFGAVCELEISP